METKWKKRKAQKCGDVNELNTSKEHFLKIAELGLLDWKTNNGGSGSSMLS